MSTPEDQVNVDDLSDAADRGDTGSQVMSALSQLAVPPTSPRQQEYAKKILDQRLSGADTSGEQSLLHDYAANADQARAALQQARERLMSQQLDPRERSFQIAQAFLSPSRYGIPDQLSKWAGVEADWSKRQREFEQNKTLQDIGLQQQMSSLDRSNLQARLALQELHERMAGPLQVAAFKAMGAPGRGAVAPMSQLGKQVEDALGPGALQTPQGRQMMQGLLTALVAEQKARAGIDASAPSPEEHAQMANVSGVPADVPDPFAGMSTKVATAARTKEQADMMKRFAAYPSQDATTQAGLRALDEFQALNAETHTGPELTPIRLGGAHIGFHGAGVESGHDSGWNLNIPGVMANFKPNIQRMDKLSQQLLGLAIPEKGFGRVTNLDMGIFQRGMLGVDKSKETNDAIAQALRIRMQNDLDRHEFEQQFGTAHGHTRNWESYWNRYLQDNPIFDPANKHQGSKGVFTLNPNRLRYDAYFREKNAEAASPTAGINPNDPVYRKDDNSQMSPDEIAAANLPAKAVGGPVELAEGGQPDDAPQQSSGIMNALNALKSGATYKGLHGGEDRESPGENLGLEVGGGAATAAALLALARRGAGQRALPRVLQAIRERPALRSSLIGAGAGALAGGMGSQDASPGADALTYGVTGALAGPLARLGAAAPARGLMGLAERLRGAPAINPGERKVIESISSDNPNLNDVATRLRKDAQLQVPSTLGEVAGPRTTGLAQAALGKDTPESAAYGAQLQQRQAGATGRVQDILNKGLMPSPGPGQFAAHEKQLQDALYANAKPLYEQAYQQFPAVQSQAIYGLMNTPSGSQAAKNAFRMMQDARIPIGQQDATGMIQHPSLQYLDYVKRALDDMITKEEGSGVGYQATNQGRLLRQMRNEFRDDIDKATQLPNGQPGLYQQARQQYGGDLEVLDALRTGRDDFNKMTPDVLRTSMANMSFAEKDAFRSGVAEHLFNRVGNAADNRNAAQVVMGTPALKEKLAAMFDRPQDATKFLDALDRESELFQQSKPLATAAQKGQTQSLSPSSLKTLAQTTMMKPETAGQISQTLSATGPQAQATLARLRGAADRLRAQTQFGNRVGDAAAAGVAGGITPTPQPEQAAQ